MIITKIYMRLFIVSIITIIAFNTQAAQKTIRSSTNQAKKYLDKGTHKTEMTPLYNKQIKKRVPTEVDLELQNFEKACRILAAHPKSPIVKRTVNQYLPGSPQKTKIDSTIKKYPSN